MSSVTPPRTSGAQSQPAPRATRRSLALALLLGAAGTAVVLIAGGRTWSEGASTAAQGALPLEASGRDVTGLPAALAVVGLAALVAVFAVRRIGRAVVASLLALSGAAVVLTSVLAVSDTAALESKAATATGLAQAGVEHVTHTAWPWVSAAGGVMLLLAGVIALRHGHHWPVMSGRYERGGQVPGRTRRPTVDPDRPEDLWKALDRGEDPTVGA